MNDPRESPVTAATGTIANVGQAERDRRIVFTEGALANDLRESPVTDAYLTRSRGSRKVPIVDIHSEPKADMGQDEIDKRIALLENALAGWLPASEWGQRIRRSFERQLEKLKHG